MRAAALIAVLVFSTVGYADNRTQADALFADGRELFAQGKFADACPKFEASQKIDPAQGTLLWLATCYEKLGRTASAWATYHLVATGATDYRGQFALSHAQALEPTLPRLVIAIPSSPSGLSVHIDNTVVNPASYNLATPYDPGAHVLEATAPNHTTFRQSITLQPSITRTVTVRF